jgi:hypothetical protein
MSNGYPTIRTGADYDAKTEWENSALLMTLNASQGLIGPLVRAVAVEATTDRIVLHVCVEAETAVLIHDLQDLIGDLEAEAVIAEPMPVIELRVEVGQPGPDWSGSSHRRLYLRSIWAEKP